jgi:hypothetical protein
VWHGGRVGEYVDNPWYYQNEVFDPGEEFLKGFVGFVYCMTNLDENKKYIGKKLFWSSKILPVNKTRKRRKRIKVESDWKNYYGSSQAVMALVERNVHFRRDIIHLCRTKGECSYYEAKEQFAQDVLLRDDYYNDFIGCKIHSKHLNYK